MQYPYLTLVLKLSICFPCVCVSIVFPCVCAPPVYIPALCVAVSCLSIVQVFGVIRLAVWCL